MASEKRAPRESYFRRGLRLVPKALRVLAFICVVWAVAIAWSAKRVEAEVQEIMLGLGAEMMDMPDAASGRLRQMNFNGAAIQMRTARTDRSLAEVLDFFEARCMSRDGRLAEQIEALSADAELEGVVAEELDGTMRFDTSTRGYVACLDMGEEAKDHEALIGRIESFLTSGDIADVGNMRYLYAQKDGEETFFATIFSDEPVNVYEMFPTEGDAPGRDAEDIPRPDGRRLLSAWETGEPYGMFVYVDPRPDVAADHAEAYHAERMPQAGWSPVTLRDGERLRVDGAHMSVWEKGDRIVTLVFEDAPEGTTTSILTSDEAPNAL